MDDETKTRFEDLDKRLVSTEKRIDDIKWFIGGTTGLFTIVFGLLTLSANFNFNTERSGIHEDVRDFKAQLLGQVEKSPQIDLLAEDGQPLVNHEVNATFKEDENKRLQLLIQFTFKNSGEALSGPMYIKIYTNDPVQFANKSTDESKFQYEASLSPESLHPSQLPGKFSFESHLHLNVVNQERPMSGKYPALIKVFYGKGQVTQSTFVMVVIPS